MTAATKRLRNVIGGSAGNLVEWYDWYAYTSLSLYFASAFFPWPVALIHSASRSASFWFRFSRMRSRWTCSTWPKQLAKRAVCRARSK